MNQIQAMALVGHSLRNNLETNSAWIFMGTTLRLAQSIGLHEAASMPVTTQLDEAQERRKRQAKHLWYHPNLCSNDFPNHRASNTMSSQVDPSMAGYPTLDNLRPPDNFHLHHHGLDSPLHRLLPPIATNNKRTKRPHLRRSSLPCLPDNARPIAPRTRHRSAPIRHAQNRRDPRTFETTTGTHRPRGSSVFPRRGILQDHARTSRATGFANPCILCGLRNLSPVSRPQHGR